MKRLFTQSVCPQAALVLVLTAAAGCGSEATPPGQAVYATYGNLSNQDRAERDSVLTAFASADTEPIRRAFQQLALAEFTRYFRTEQLDKNEYLVAFRERTVRHSGLPGSRRFDLVEEDSSGMFEFGFFEQFVSANVETQDPRDLAEYLLLADPPYLMPQNYEAYFYRMKPDSLMGDGLARVFEVRARPESGDGKNIRRVRLFVDSASNALVAIQLDRIDLALFFREESRFFVHIQNTEAGWVPLTTRFESLIVMPFRPPQLFRTVAAYSDVKPVVIEE
ncbi:MAG: hypothetical protein SH809_11435 [Rhodothermales bacterium]|nr:hypothetical protein [Rhodothermales bacterium]